MKKRHLLINIGIVLLILVGIILIGKKYLIDDVANQISTNHSKKASAQIKKGKPFSILILGTDVGALGRGVSYAGNTDTMELMTINPDKHQVLLTAIPRDTLVKVNTKKGTDYVKINAVYAIGGEKLIKKQVSELLDVPVNYYALVNMGMLEKVVDAVGGVEVDNPFEFKFDGHTYPKGKQKLNGKLALGYSRMRYDDPDNDYGRQKRGQQVVFGALNKFKKNGNLVTLVNLFNDVKGNIQTDLPLDDPIALYKNYSSSINNLKNDGLRGKDAWIDGISFQIATSAEINRVSKNIRTALGLKPVHVSNAETKMVASQTSWNGYDNVDFILPNGAKYNSLGYVK